LIFFNLTFVTTIIVLTFFFKYKNTQTWQQQNG
jgi:hypothetical protein